MFRVLTKTIDSLDLPKAIMQWPEIKTFGIHVYNQLLLYLWFVLR